MKVERFLELCPSDFFAGVPDSQLKALCDELMEKYGTGKQHHIVANEGNAVALAAGYHLATGKVPMVYLQNSGEGNAMNPLVSLASERVYGIPLLLVIGYRGEPGVKDEPQHLFQGEITLDFLKLLQIPYFVLEKGSQEEELKKALEGFAKEFQRGKQAAIVVKKGALEKEHGYHYNNAYNFSREEAIRCIVDYTGDSPIVSTTGKASRELYEIREERGEDHSRDFLTVGSMGHASSIALGIALEKENERVVCLDGDGALLMHMGAMAVLGASGQKNILHILLNNEAHETVGGQPTVSPNIDYGSVAKACGYSKSYLVRNQKNLERVLLESAKEEGPIFLEVRCAMHSRENLGRPKESPRENKELFMKKLEK